MAVGELLQVGGHLIYRHRSVSTGHGQFHAEIVLPLLEVVLKCLPLESVSGFRGNDIGAGDGSAPFSYPGPSRGAQVESLRFPDGGVFYSDYSPRGWMIG